LDAVSAPGRPDDGYRDVVGVIHIHTRYSHDAHGRFEDVVRTANAQRLDYCILTEHNNLRALRDGKQGWHGMTLVLVGTELSTRSGHYLALNVTEEIDRYQPVQDVIDEVNRQGGLGFIAHPYFKNGRWKDWSVTGFTGIEAYNVAHDTLDENLTRLVFWTLAAPAGPFYFSILDRPYDPLATWDELIRRHGKVVGIGSADAHEFHVGGLKFAPYEVMFRLARTHLLIPGETLTADAAYAALRQGRAYFAIELVAEAKGFSFFAAAGTRVVGVMGDEVALEPTLHLMAWLPAPAQVTLFRDGRPIATTIGQDWDIPVTEAGAYRLEAVRHDKPWIFSNPIYVRPAPSAAEGPAVPPADPVQQPAASEHPRIPSSADGSDAAAPTTP
jgi:hypothetical protein